MKDSIQNVDGITQVQGADDHSSASKKTASERNGNAEMQRAKFALITIIAIPYLLYLGWSIFLLSVLPDTSGSWDSFIPIGSFIALLFLIGFLGVGLFAFMRVGKSKEATERNKMLGLAKIAACIAPGLIMSIIVPLQISKEPSLRFYQTEPVPGSTLIAPISINFNADEAVEVLSRRNLSVNAFLWDFQGDGTIDEETVTPEAIAYYDRQGAYTINLVMRISDGSTRSISSRLVIPQSVFSYHPIVPVVNENITFSVAHLIRQEKDVSVREIQWDFDADGLPDITGVSPEVEYSFLKTGPQKVRVTIVYSNQTQNVFERTLDIQYPAPNPFPVDIKTTPEFLESPAPFQVIFSLETDEPIQEITWDFDDGSPEETGTRVGHTFTQRRVYQVTAQVKSVDGQVAKISRVVKVVDPLVISDLSFAGTHQVGNNSTIEAQVPVAIELMPKTTKPLVDFWWEVDNASQISSTDTILQAIFRDEGIYTLLLLAKDPEGRVLRKPITLDVQPRTSFITFDMKPTQGIAPLTVNFDASESYVPGQEITGFTWDFGETKSGNPRPLDAKVQHVYTEPGEYTVSLTVTTVSGTTESISKKIVVRAPVLKSCFTMSRMEGQVPLGVRFDASCSTGEVSSIVWEFGDGAQAESNSLDEPVDHVYTTPGTYTVTLSVMDKKKSTSVYTQKVLAKP